MASFFDDSFGPGRTDTTFTGSTFEPARPSGAFEYPQHAVPRTEFEYGTDLPDGGFPASSLQFATPDAPRRNLLSAPMGGGEPTEFQKMNVNWADPDDAVGEGGPVRTPAPQDFLEVDYEFGRKDGPTDAPVEAANIFGRRMSAEKLMKYDEGRRLLDLMGQRRRGDHNSGGTLANLARGLFDYSASDIPFYGWVSDIGTSAGDAIKISRTMRKLQDGEKITSEEGIQVSRFLLQSEMESQRTGAYQTGAVMRQMVGFMAEMYLTGLAGAVIGGAATGGPGAIPGFVVGAALAPLKFIGKLMAKSAPKAAAKVVTDRAMAGLARSAAKGYTRSEAGKIAAKGFEVFGSGKAYRAQLSALRAKARESLAASGKEFGRAEVNAEAHRMMADVLSTRSVDSISARNAARTLLGADYRTAAEAAVDSGVRSRILSKMNIDAATFAGKSGAEQTRLLREGWKLFTKKERDAFAKEIVAAAGKDASAASADSILRGMEETTGRLVNRSFAGKVTKYVVDNAMRSCELRYGSESLARTKRFGRWLADHMAKGLLQSEHAFLEGGAPTVGHAGFSSFHYTSDALKEGIGRVFVEAPLRGAVQATLGPLALSPLFSLATGNGATDAVFKGQLGFQAQALMTGDREKMDGARQAAIGSLFVEYASESAGRGLGLLVGGALTANPLARRLPGVGFTTESVTGTIGRAKDSLLNTSISKQAGNMLSKAIDMVYGLGHREIDKFSSLAARHLGDAIRSRGIKGASATADEIRTLMTRNSLEGASEGLRKALSELKITSVRQLAHWTALAETHGDRVAAFRNMIGLRLAERGFTPLEIMRKFRQFGQAGSILEEMGEEWLGDFARGLFGWDDTTSDRDVGDMVRSMFSGLTDPQQLATEFFGFALPGVARRFLSSTHRWIATGKLAETKESARRLRTVMDIVQNGKAGISFYEDARQEEATKAHEARGQELLRKALGDHDSNMEAATASSSSAFANRASIVDRVKAAGGLQAESAGTAEDPAAEAASTLVDMIAGSESETQMKANMAEVVESLLQSSSVQELDRSLARIGAVEIFGSDGVAAIRREYRRQSDREFAADDPVEMSLAEYKAHVRDTSSIRAPIDSTDGAVEDVAVTIGLASEDRAATAGTGTTNADHVASMLDDGLRDTVVDDLATVARNAARASLELDGSIGMGRRALAKIVGLVQAWTTGDCSLAVMNPAAYAAIDSQTSPELLQAAMGAWSGSLADGFKATRDRFDAAVSEKIEAAVASGSGLMQALRDAKVSAADIDAMEAAGRASFMNSVKSLADRFMVANGILTVSRAESLDAALRLVAGKHRSGDGYGLPDGTVVADYTDPKFAAGWAAELAKAKSDIVEGLVRIAGDRDALRFSTSARLGSDSPFFALDVVRAIRNGTSAEVMGAILATPAFYNMAKVMNLSGLSEHDKETVFTAMNSTAVDLSDLTSIDTSSDLDDQSLFKVAAAMHRNLTRYTDEENQAAAKSFVDRLRLVHRSGLTRFEDTVDGSFHGTVQPGEGGTFRAIVQRMADGAVTTELDREFPDYDQARAAVLGFSFVRKTDGGEQRVDNVFVEKTKTLVVTTLNQLTSTDATSMVFFLYNNDRDALRREYLRRIGGARAVRFDQLPVDIGESGLPPFLRKTDVGDGRKDWAVNGPSAMQRTAEMFRRELERARFYEANRGHPLSWRTDTRTSEADCRRAMEEDGRIYDSVFGKNGYETVGGAILGSSGVRRTVGDASTTLGIADAYAAHLNYMPLRTDDVVVISPDYNSEGHNEGLLRLGLDSSIRGWLSGTGADADDRRLLMARANHEFMECAERVASELSRTDKAKAGRLRETVRRVVRPNANEVSTKSLAAIASASVFFSCDRGLMGEGNGFFDGPEMAAVADEFRRSPVFPIFVSAVHEALGGQGIFHYSKTGESHATFGGLPTWLRVFGRDGASVVAARSSTVFGEGDAAKNPFVAWYSFRSGTTRDTSRSGMTMYDPAAHAREDGIGRDGRIASFSGDNVVPEYLKSVAVGAGRFAQTYAELNGLSDVVLSAADMFRMARQSDMFGGETASGAKASFSRGFIRTAAVNMADRIQAQEMPFEMSRENAVVFGSALRGVQRAMGLSVSEGRTRMSGYLRDLDVPADIVDKVMESYDVADMVAGPESEDARVDTASEAADDESGESSDTVDHEARIAELANNKDLGALAAALRWVFPESAGSVSVLCEMMKTEVAGEMLSDSVLDRMAARSVISADTAAEVRKFRDAMTVALDARNFNDRNARSALWGSHTGSRRDDEAEVDRMLDAVVEALGKADHVNYAVAVAAIRNIPRGNRGKVLQMVAQATSMTGMSVTRDDDMGFEVRPLESLVESARTSSVVRSSYVSLLTIGWAEGGAKFAPRRAKSAKDLATSLATVMGMMSYTNGTAAELAGRWRNPGGPSPLMSRRISDALRPNFVDVDSLPRYVIKSGTKGYPVAVDAADFDAVMAMYNGIGDRKSAIEALDRIQETIWNRMQVQAKVVDMLFGTGSGLARMLRSRDALAYVRRAAEDSVLSGFEWEPVVRRLRRELGLGPNAKVPEDELAKAKENFASTRRAGLEGLFTFANYFACSNQTNKHAEEWNIPFMSAFLSDTVQEPIAYILHRLGLSDVKARKANGSAMIPAWSGMYVNTGVDVDGNWPARDAIADALAAKLEEAAKRDGTTARDVVRRLLSEAGELKTFFGLPLDKGRSLDEMATGRNVSGSARSTFDEHRVMGTGGRLRALVNAYVSSLPQSSRTIGGRARDAAEAVKNRGITTTPSDLPADIRMKNSRLFTEVRIGGRSLTDILEGNGNRWSDGSRPLVSVVGAKDVDGTLIQKDRLAGILNSAIVDQFVDGTSNHVVFPFFRADKPSCFGVSMPRDVAAEMVRQVAASDELMSELRPDLADAVREAAAFLDEADAAKAEAEVRIPEKTDGRTVSSFLTKEGRPTFLSNFFEAPVRIGGTTYRSAEAAFQARRQTYSGAGKAVDFSAMDAAAARKAGESVKLTAAEQARWDDAKLGEMENIVRAKFAQNPALRERLAKSDGYYLEDGNTRDDRYWGTVDGVGENHLGRILMKVRGRMLSGGERTTREIDGLTNLYDAMYGIVVTAAGQADIDPKRVATTLSTGAQIPLYKIGDGTDDKTAACYFVSALGGRSAASLTGGYQLTGCGAMNARMISEGNPQALKLHIYGTQLNVNFKKGQGNDFGLGWEGDEESCHSAVNFFRRQMRTTVINLLGSKLTVPSGLALPKGMTDILHRVPERPDDMSVSDYAKVVAAHRMAVETAKRFLSSSTIIADDLETNKAGLFGSSCGLSWDKSRDGAFSITVEIPAGEGKTESVTVGWDGRHAVGTNGWDVAPDAKNGQMPIAWVLSAVAMARGTGLTESEVAGIRFSVPNKDRDGNPVNRGFRLANQKTTEPATLAEAGLLSDGEGLSVRVDGDTAFMQYRTRTMSAQIVANNANSSVPEYGHVFAVNATRDMEMMEEFYNVSHPESGRRGNSFVNAHAGYSLLQLAVLRGNPGLVGMACAGDSELVDAYNRHPWDPEVRGKVADKVSSFLRRQMAVSYLGSHGVMCPSAGNGHAPLDEDRGSHLVRIEWLPGTTQFDKDMFRPAEIYGSAKREYYGHGRGWGSGCVNVRADGFRFGLFLDDERFDAFAAAEKLADSADGSGLRHGASDSAKMVEAGLCGADEARRVFLLKTALVRARADQQFKMRLLSCFTDHTGRRADSGWGAEKMSFDDLFLPDRESGRDDVFDDAAVDFGSLRRESVGGKACVYLGGSIFCAHRSPSGNIESFQGTVRATAPYTFDGKTGRPGKEAKYALDPITMMLQGSDTDGDSAGLQFMDYTVPRTISQSDIDGFVAECMAPAAGGAKGGYEDRWLGAARRRGWTETSPDGYEVVKDEVFAQFTRAVFVAQAENYRNAETFHQSQPGREENGLGAKPGDVIPGHEVVDRYADPSFVSDVGDYRFSRELDNMFVCDYGWAGRQPVGTDAVWDEKVDWTEVDGLLSGSAKDILGRVKAGLSGDRLQSLTYDKLLDAFVDAAGYGEKTNDLLRSGKSSMLSDAAADSAKSRGISVFNQSRFLRGLHRGEIVDHSGAPVRIPARTPSGYIPLIDLTSHFDGISNNLFDTLKKMFATRAGWTQQLLPFFLSDIVYNTARSYQRNPDARVSNAFVFSRLAQMLSAVSATTSDGRPRHLLGSVARYSDPVNGRVAMMADLKTMLADAGKRSELDRLYPGMPLDRIVDTVLYNGSSVFGLGKEDRRNDRMRLLAAAYILHRGHEASAKAELARLMDYQSMLDSSKAFGEEVDYLAMAGKSYGKQRAVASNLVTRAVDELDGRDDVDKTADRLSESLRNREFRGTNGGASPAGVAITSGAFGSGTSDVQRVVTGAYADTVLSMADSPDLASGDRDGAFAAYAGDRRATGAEYDANYGKTVHLAAALTYGGDLDAQLVRAFGSTTREFMLNFADAVRFASNNAWRKYTAGGYEFDPVNHLLRMLDGRSGKTTLRCRVSSDSMKALQRGFSEMMTRDGSIDLEFNGKKTTMPLRSFGKMLLVHASAGDTFGAVTSYVGQSSLPAVFGDDVVAELESRSAGVAADLAMVPPVQVGNGKVFDFMPILADDLLASALMGGTSDANGPSETFRSYRAFGDQNTTRRKSVDGLESGLGAHVEFADLPYAGGSKTAELLGAPDSWSVSPAFGTPLRTRTVFKDALGNPIRAFRAGVGDMTGGLYASPEEAFNRMLELRETRAYNDPTGAALAYRMKTLAENGHAPEDLEYYRTKALTSIIREAAAEVPDVHDILMSAGGAFLVRRHGKRMDMPLTSAFHSAASAVVDGRIPYPSTYGGPKARMSDTLGGDALDADATREDFFDRISGSHPEYRGATLDQMRRSIPEAIREGLRTAFGDSVSVSAVLNQKGEATNMLRVERTMSGRKVVTYISYGESLGQGMSTEDTLASLADMLSARRSAKGLPAVTADDLRSLAGPDIRILEAALRVSGVQSGESSAINCGFAPVMSGIIRLSNTAGFETLFHEYFHSMLRGFRQLGVYDDKDRDELAKSFHGPDGKFDEEAAADAFARFVTGTESGWDDDKLKDYVGDGSWDRVFRKFKRAAEGLATAMTRGVDSRGVPVFILTTMWEGSLTEEQAAKITEPSAEDVGRIERFLLSEKGVFDPGAGPYIAADRMESCAGVVDKILSDIADGSATVKSISTDLASLSGAESAPTEPASVPFEARGEARPVDSVSKFLNAALTRFERSGMTDRTAADLDAYRVNRMISGSGDASIVVYRAKRLIREVAAAAGIALERAGKDGIELTEAGRALLTDDKVAELAMRLLVNSDAERASTGGRASNASADYAFARALEWVKPDSYWRFCSLQASKSREAFAAAAAAAEASAAANASTDPMLAERKRKEATELYALSNRIEMLAALVSSGADLHCYVPADGNKGNLHGLLFSMFSGGAKMTSRDSRSSYGILEYDQAAGHGFSFDMSDPAIRLAFDYAAMALFVGEAGRSFNRKTGALGRKLVVGVGDDASQLDPRIQEKIDEVQSTGGVNSDDPFETISAENRNTGDEETGEANPALDELVGASPAETEETGEANPALDELVGASPAETEETGEANPALDELVGASSAETGEANPVLDELVGQGAQTVSGLDSVPGESPEDMARNDAGPAFTDVDVVDQSPDWILSNPGLWLSEDIQPSLAGSDLRGIVTDHRIKARCERAYAVANMMIQTLGLDVCVDGKVRKMVRRDSNLGIDSHGDFAYGDAFKHDTIGFSRTNGALLGMFAWEEDRVGEKLSAKDIQMAHYIAQMVSKIASRDSYAVTGVVIPRSVARRDLERLASGDLARWYSPAALLRRHTMTAEQRREDPQNEETALDLAMYRFMMYAAPSDLMFGKGRDETSADVRDGTLYGDFVSAIAAGHANAPVDDETGEPRYADGILGKLREAGLAADGGRDRTTVATVPIRRAVAAWHDSDVYRKLSDPNLGARPKSMLDPYAWATRIGREYNLLNRAAAGSKYLRTGAGSNFSLAGSTAHWFHGGSGTHVFDVAKYQNALAAMGPDMKPSVEAVLRENEAELFDIIDNAGHDRLGKTAFDADGSANLSDRSIKYLAFLLGITTRRSDGAFDVRAFARQVAEGGYEDARIPLRRDMTVADAYILVNRLVAANTLDAMLAAGGLPAKERQSLVDRTQVNDMLAAKLAETAPGVISARSEAQEFAMTGRLGDSRTAPEQLVGMCRELVAAERFRGGLAQMLTTVSADGTPNYIVSPSDAVVETSGLPDEYWGALARFVAQRYTKAKLAYDMGLSGVENLRAMHRLVADMERASPGSTGYHGLAVDRMRADTMFNGVLCASSGLDQAGNVNVMTEAQGGEAECYFRQLFSLFTSPSIDDKWRRLEHVMSWSKIASVGFSAFFNVATALESPTAATGFWHTIMGQTELGAKAARAIGRAAGRSGGTGAFQSDAVFMSDLAQFLNSNDPFVRKARELCDLIGMPLDNTADFTNDRNDSNPVLGGGNMVKQDIESLTRWMKSAGFKQSRINAARSMLNFMYKSPTDYTFNVVLNAVKMSVVMQTMRRLREECALGSRPFDPVKELRRHSAYINAEIGGIDPGRMAWATPEMRKLLSLGMFSWQWTVGAWTAGGGDVVTNAIFGGHTTTEASRRRSFIRWIRMLGIVKFGIPLVLQAGVKALSEALSAGLPPDDDLKKEIDDMPWLCPLNESRVGSLNFDVTPLLKLAGRVPGVREYKESGTLGGRVVAGAVGAAAGAATTHGWKGAAAGAAIAQMNSWVPAYVGGGRNTTGKRRYYMHFGKQSDEFFRWFEDPLSQMLAKTSVPVQKAFEGVFGGLNPSGYRKPFADLPFLDRVFNMNMSPDDNAIVNLLTSVSSFSGQSIASNPDAGFLAAVGPLKMGESKRSVRIRIENRLRDFVEDDRHNNPWSYPGNRKKLNLLCMDILREARLNGVPPDTIMTSALGDLAKTQYNRLMASLPNDPSSRRLDTEKARSAVRALVRINRKYSAIRDSVVERFKSAGLDIKKSPEMRRAVFDLIRLSRQYPFQLTDEEAKKLFSYMDQADPRYMTSTQMDDRGGENFGNFLATDEVPDTLFGVPVVVDVTDEDAEFFRTHPEAGGFYDLGE